MPQARRLVLPSESRLTYHVISRCSRRSWLMGGEHAHRRSWAAGLLGDLLGIFSVDLQAYAIMSNHVHLVLRPRPDRIADWSDERVARIGLRGIPVRPGNIMNALPASPVNVRAYASNPCWIAEYRSRLSSLSWFMKLFKQRLARRANRVDGCTGHFWESRFQTIPLLDNGAVVACMAYVDLNPMRAGIGSRIGEAPYCSIRHRLLAEGLLSSNGGDCEADQGLARHLIPLSACHPVDSAGAIPRTHLSLEEYLAFMDPVGPSRLHDRYGIDKLAWSQRSLEPGAFQGVAVGGESARRNFASRQGKRTLADKTRIWVDEK